MACQLLLVLLFFACGSCLRGERQLGALPSLATTLCLFTFGLNELVSAGGIRPVRIMLLSPIANQTYGTHHVGIGMSFLWDVKKFNFTPSDVKLTIILDGLLLYFDALLIRRIVLPAVVPGPHLLELRLISDGKVICGSTVSPFVALPPEQSILWKGAPLPDFASFPPPFRGALASEDNFWQRLLAFNSTMFLNRALAALPAANEPTLAVRATLAGAKHVWHDNTATTSRCGPPPPPSPPFPVAVPPAGGDKRGGGRRSGGGGGGDGGPVIRVLLATDGVPHTDRSAAAEVVVPAAPFSAAECAALRSLHRSCGDRLLPLHSLRPLGPGGLQRVRQRITGGLDWVLLSTRRYRRALPALRRQLLVFLLHRATQGVILHSSPVGQQQEGAREGAEQEVAWWRAELHDLGLPSFSLLPGHGDGPASLTSPPVVLLRRPAHTGQPWWAAVKRRFLGAAFGSPESHPRHPRPLSLQTGGDGDGNGDGNGCCEYDGTCDAHGDGGSSADPFLLAHRRPHYPPSTPPLAFPTQPAARQPPLYSHARFNFLFGANTGIVTNACTDGDAVFTYAPAPRTVLTPRLIALLQQGPNGFKWGWQIYEEHSAAPAPGSPGVTWHDELAVLVRPPFSRHISHFAEALTPLFHASLHPRMYPWLPAAAHLLLLNVPTNDIAWNREYLRLTAATLLHPRHRHRRSSTSSSGGSGGSGGSGVGGDSAHSAPRVWYREDLTAAPARSTASTAPASGHPRLHCFRRAALLGMATHEFGMFADPWEAHLLRQRAWAQHRMDGAPLPLPPNAKLRVALVRRQSSVRRLLNEREVIAMLNYTGVVDMAYLRSHTLSMEHATFRQQLQWMQTTDVLIAVHGAALQNAQFMAHGSVAIDILPSKFIEFEWHNHLSSAGISYFFVHSSDMARSSDCKPFPSHCRLTSAFHTNTRDCLGIRNCNIRADISQLQALLWQANYLIRHRKRRMTRATSDATNHATGHQAQPWGRGRRPDGVLEPIGETSSSLAS